MQEPVARGDLRFTEEMNARPKPGLFDVDSGLQHFAIVTYAIPAERLRPLVHRRFDLETIEGPDGSPQALISMVPFMDKDFHSAWLNYPQLTFGQTNYRAYVIDRYTGDRVAWFFGTTLDSWSVAIPNRLWKLPWYRAHSTFDCEYDESAGRYSHYRLSTQSDWAPVTLELEDTGEPPTELRGFDSLEAARVILTHPFIGAFYRRDRRLGSYSVWHAPLELTVGRVKSAKIGLFEDLGLLTADEALQPHSVLIQPITQFTIYLPPKKLGRPGG
ncbi:MAG: DUF2071 domain-containing protein [Dehalococcoidia bacterium]